ncbi:hypothetical protein [uncultured Oscillibacter sp.]|uniref:hypothetical protein n=1 Tax=uncultured Oscillibacter sp. TaxID=876091 RepID=UPI00266F8CBC|nr:hypothetical protein [uncultured Oscillibacter sp.]
MRVAVVDDGARDREWLAGELAALLARRRLEGTVAAFASGESFLEAARAEHYQHQMRVHTAGGGLLPGCAGICAGRCRRCCCRFWRSWPWLSAGW